MGSNTSGKIRTLGAMTIKTLLLCSLTAATAACSQALQITVLYDHIYELRPGDSVLMEQEVIGSVDSIEVTPEGRYAVRIKIEKESRSRVTDHCRFLIQKDPHRPQRKALEILCTGKPGSPLADGSTVEGTSPFDMLLDRSARDLQNWAEQLRREMERWRKDLEDLPEKEWFRDLEEQMDIWARSLEKAGKEARRYFRDEILPSLEEALEALRKKLKEEGREKETDQLRQKLDELKGI